MYCTESQATRVTRHSCPRIGFYPNKTERFQFIHVDLIGPMNITYENNKSILTIKDRWTKFLVTVSIIDIKRKLSEMIELGCVVHLILIIINNLFCRTLSIYTILVCIGNVYKCKWSSDIKSNKWKKTKKTFEATFFLHTMSNISRKHNCYLGNAVYYETKLFKCGKVWLERNNRSKMSALYQGLYPVHSYKDQTMVIERNYRLFKVSISNVKCYLLH